MKCFVVLAALAACAYAAPSGFITNGEDAKLGQFPHQISLQWGIMGLFQHMCGGSIIAPEWILTAGHCITELPIAGDMKIRAGILQLTDSEHMQEIEVVERIVHPDYQGGVNPNDIALLKLAKPLEFNDYVQPIGLPKEGVIPEGESTLSGWGSTSTGQIPSMPNTLQTINLPVLPHQECADALTAIMGSPEPLTTSNVCTGPLTGGKSACSGDSGGPLVQDKTIIGIVSWGIMPCGSEGAPSVYTQVSSFNDFIHRHVRNL
ncbi:PREDICTED: trypsin-1-like [Nicrophorus vespilloides]|uniref:Trypsin-1-like n=1 Tax=Nicrophorus vespilloides TaxID=110193 RepID=A0ABM1M211_NICVS|nr:PREDICTED: trypsin-1-like [Nicrophorus vespilloides]